MNLMDSELEYKAIKSYPLLHMTESHARPVVFKKGKHNSYACYTTYPLFLDTENKQVRIATDYIIMVPKIYVKQSIPFELTYPISEMYIQ